MIQKIRTNKLYPVLLLALLLSLLAFTVAYAANIDGTNKWAWGTNIGWLNFAPGEGGGVTVYTNHLEGYVWAENVGWIRLNSDDTTGGTPYYANTTKDNYGVNRDGSGNLSGYAWGTNIGWISFACENTSSCGTVNYGVTIFPSGDDAGDFDGYAWGENVGWIHFKNTSGNAYKVTTTTPTVVRLSSFTTRVGDSLVALMVLPLALVALGAVWVIRKRQ